MTNVRWSGRLGNEPLRKNGLTTGSWRHLAAGIAGAGLIGFLALHSVTAQDHQAVDTPAVADQRIPPSDVTLENLEAFQEQVRYDLPVGTAKRDVEEYLTLWQMPHDFFGRSYGSLGNSFHAVVEDLGLYHGFIPRLSVWIYLDDKDLVREVKFRTTFF